jgi:hypothetical protein
MYQIWVTRELLTGFRAAHLKVWFQLGDTGPNRGTIWTNLGETGCGDVEWIRLQGSYANNSNESPHHNRSSFSSCASITLPPHSHYFWLDCLRRRVPNESTDLPLVANLIPTAPENSLAVWTIAEEWKRSLVLVNVRFHKTRAIS